MKQILKAANKPTKRNSSFLFVFYFVALPAFLAHSKVVRRRTTHHYQRRLKKKTGRLSAKAKGWLSPSVTTTKAGCEQWSICVPEASSNATCFQNIWAECSQSDSALSLDHPSYEDRAQRLKKGQLIKLNLAPAYLLSNGEIITPNLTLAATSAPAVPGNTHHGVLLRPDNVIGGHRWLVHDRVSKITDLIRWN